MRRSKYNVRTDKAGKVPESSVLRACLDLLAAEKIWWMRLNVGAVKIGNRFIKFAKSGTADILAIPQVKCDCGQQGCLREWTLPLWVECKSDTGRQSAAQREFEADVTAKGQAYMMARSSDDLKNWLIEHGVIRK